MLLRIFLLVIYCINHRIISIKENEIGARKECELFKMNYSKSSQISSQISPYLVSPFYVNTIKKFYFLKNIKKKNKRKN